VEALADDDAMAADSPVLAVDEEEAGDRFRDNVGLARDVVTGLPFELGRPPDDLTAVLATLALGGPGVIALRALGRINDGKDHLTELPLRDAAARIGWSLRGLFNRPEVMA